MAFYVPYLNRKSIDKETWAQDKILRFLRYLLYKGCMHVLFNKADELSRRVIGAAIEVHRLKGPGLIESIYERCL